MRHFSDPKPRNRLGAVSVEICARKLEPGRTCDPFVAHLVQLSGWRETGRANQQGKVQIERPPLAWKPVLGESCEQNTVWLLGAILIRHDEKGFAFLECRGRSALKTLIKKA